MVIGALRAELEGDGFPDVDVAVRRPAAVDGARHDRYPEHQPSPGLRFHPLRPSGQPPHGVGDVVPRLGSRVVFGPHRRTPEPLRERVHARDGERPAIDAERRIASGRIGRDGRRGRPERHRDRESRRETVATPVAPHDADRAEGGLLGRAAHRTETGGHAWDRYIGQRTGRGSGPTHVEGVHRNHFGMRRAGAPSNGVPWNSGGASRRGPSIGNGTNVGFALARSPRTRTT